VGFLLPVFNAYDWLGRQIKSKVLFMCGGAVGALVLLSCKEVLYALLVEQIRLGAGGLYLEAPVGMLDGEGNVLLKIADEMEEELGFRPNLEDLVSLSDLANHERGFFPSVGGCDETIRLYYVCYEVDEDTLHKLDGRKTGLAKEGEYIRLTYRPFAELWKLTDSKILIAWALFKELVLEKGKLVTHKPPAL